MSLREIALPVLTEGAALLRVEANGICASDIDAYRGGLLDHTLPRVNGHEIVGVVEDVGPGGRADGVAIGDRVAVNPLLSCGQCPACRRGEEAFCTGWPVRPATYGFMPTTFGPGLWGGYATHVYLHPRTVVYPFPATTDPLDATLWNPLACGIQWAVANTGATIGTSVAILGSGQRGLACLLATRLVGAGPVLVTGLARDAHKLALAKEFGADLVVDVESEDVRERAAELTGGRGFDVVVDTTPHATSPVLDALEILRPGGVFAPVGVKGRAMPDFPIDTVVNKGLRIVGAIGAGHAAHAHAARLIGEGAVPICRMRTHVFGFDQLPEALETLAGRRGEAINVVVTPTTTVEARSAGGAPGEAEPLAQRPSVGPGHQAPMA